MSSPPVELSPFGHALAGALGAVFSNAVVYPLDTVKTVIQANKNNAKGKAKEGTVPQSMLSLLLKIFKEEGLLGYYKGFGTTMLNAFSTQYAYFFFYSTVREAYIKRIVRKLPPGSAIPALSTAAELLLGAIAGALAQIFTIPVSVIAVRQQISQTKKKQIATSSKVVPEKSYAGAVKEEPAAEKLEEGGEDDEEETNTSFMAVARRIIKEHGLAGLWLGLKPALVLTVNPSITYGVFERVKSIVLLGSTNKKMSPWIAFLVGALSKTLATIVTYPYIMAKVRIQAGTTQPDESSLPTPVTSPGARQGEGAVNLLARVHRDEGFVGWYRGMQAQIVKAVLSQALLFVSKDQFEIYALMLMQLIHRLRYRV